MILPQFLLKASSWFAWERSLKSTGYLRCGGPWSQSLDKILTNSFSEDNTGFLKITPFSFLVPTLLHFHFLYFLAMCSSIFFFCYPISSSFISNNHFCDYEMFDGVSPVFKLLHTFIWSSSYSLLFLSVYFSLYGPNHLPYIHSSLYQVI